MFRQALYVPVLRWKRAERVALRWLDSDVKALMTPLLEIPPTDFQRGASNEALFAAAARQVAMNWGRAPAFVDFRLLGLGLSRGVSFPSIALFFSEARLYKLQLIPVTYLGLPPEFQRVIGSVANQDGRGVCIRLISQNLASRTLPSDLHHSAAALGLRYEEMDLVVDLRIAETSNPSFVSLFDRLPAVERWRSFTVIAGAFPKDLTEFSVGQHLYPRIEWAQWINQVRSAPPEQMRIPTFGDYTIQHAVYYEPPEGANVSASIRYTTDEHWLVMRGGGLRTPCQFRKF